MYTPLEHDYIGLSEASSVERSSDKVSASSSSFTVSTDKHNVLNFKETELRLGLPGSHPQKKKSGLGVSLFGKDLEDKSDGYLKNFVSGVKRGFSVAIDGSDKWVFSVNDGSEVDLGKCAPCFSPRVGENGNWKTNNTEESCLSGSIMKEVVLHSTNSIHEKKNQVSRLNQDGSAPATKAQVVGWPPIRSFRKNNMATNLTKNSDDEGKSGSECIYLKVSMDGAPYLRKVDLKNYSNYTELSSALEKMFSCFTIGQCSSHGLPTGDGLSENHLMDLLHGSEYVLTYEDKDGDWMLVGDVPWDMFTNSCKRMRIMKGSEAIGLAPRAMQKCKNRD